MKLKLSSRTLWAISLPIIVAGANETIVDVTDTIFLARYGTIELGAVALAATIYEVVSFFTFGLGDGIQIICARRAGQASERGIGDAFNHGTGLLLATSVVLFLVLRFLSPVGTEWLLRSPDVQAAVDAFLGIIAFAVFFHSLNLAYSAFYVGIARTRVLIGATTALALTNIALDYVLIFGKFGLPELGIRGAAFGSLFAEIVTFLFLTGYAVWKGDVRRFGLFRFGRPNPVLGRVMLRVSWPVSMEALLGTVRWLMFFVMVEQVGEGALAGANIIYSIYALFLLPIDGFSDTTTTVVSNFIGQDDSRRIGAVVRRAMGWSAALVLPLLTVAAAIPELPLAIFTSDPTVLEGAVASLRVVSLAVMIVIPAEMVFAAVAGTGDTRTTLLIELVFSTTVLAYVYSAALVFHLPLAAIWVGEILGWLACFMLSLLWLRSERWKRLDI
jgi:putative MATE family efflux protein